MAEFTDTPVIPALQIINNGDVLNDPTAESVYASFEKCKINFNNIWDLLDSQGYEKFYLPLNGIDTTQNEMVYIAQAIERGRYVDGNYGTPWQTTKGRKLLFFTISGAAARTAEQIDDQELELVYKFYRIHRIGQVFGGDGGIIINSSHVSPAGSYKVNESGDVTGLAFIDLGNIGSAEVWDAFNLGQPAPNLGDEWEVEGECFVLATQNGTKKTWRFGGGQGLWGGDDYTNPNYLEAQEEDFDLLSNQPENSSSLYITKTSKRFMGYNLTTAIILPISPESTSFNLANVNPTGVVRGFSANSITQTLQPPYDGMDIFIRNFGTTDIVLNHQDATVGVTYKFWFKDGLNHVLKPNDIVALKYVGFLNRVELVGDISSITEVTGSTITFVNNSEHNSLSPISGDITIDPSNAKAGIYKLVHVNSVSEPSIIGAAPLMITGKFYPSVLNLYHFVWSGSGKYILVIQSNEMTFPSFTTTGFTESPDDVHQNTSGTSFSGAYGTSLQVYSGDFNFKIPISDTDTIGGMIGFSTLGTKRPWNDGTNPWKYILWTSIADNTVRVSTDGASSTAADTPTTVSVGSDFLELRRISNNVYAYYAGVEIHDFGTLTGNLYLHISANTSKYIKYPQIS